MAELTEELSKVKAEEPGVPKADVRVHPNPEPVGKKPMDAPTGTPTVIVDDLHIVYRVYGAASEHEKGNAVNALTRATLDESPARDITTTRSGLFLNGLSRHAPRRFVDWVILRSFRKNLKGRDMGHAAPPLAEFAARLAGSDRRR